MTLRLGFLNSFFTPLSRMPTCFFPRCHPVVDVNSSGAITQNDAILFGGEVRSTACKVSISASLQLTRRKPWQPQPAPAACPTPRSPFDFGGFNQRILSSPISNQMFFIFVTSFNVPRFLGGPRTKASGRKCEITQVTLPRISLKQGLFFRRILGDLFGSFFCDFPRRRLVWSFQSFGVLFYCQCLRGKIRIRHFSIAAWTARVTALQASKQPWSVPSESGVKSWSGTPWQID